MSENPPTRLREIVRAAEREGWRYDTTSKGHPRLTPPRGLRHEVDRQGTPIRGRVTFEGDGPLVAPVTFAATPSDVRGDRNAAKTLERAGVRL